MLTRQEKKWVADLQKLLDKCPSDRLGFYTIGDPDINIYDRTRQKEIDRLMDGGLDFGPAVHTVDADLGELKFPSHVHSTAG